MAAANGGLRLGSIRRSWLRQSRISIRSRGLCDRFRAGCVHRPHIHVEQGVALIALVLVLLPQLDDLLEDLNVETLALGLRKDLLLRLVQLLQFAVQMLDPLNEGTDSSAGNADVRHGASLLNEIVKMTAKTSPMC